MTLDTFTEVTVPGEALMLTKMVMPRFRVHQMMHTLMIGTGDGAVVDYGYAKSEIKPGVYVRGDTPKKFAVFWGMRPIGVELDGFISLATQWKLLKTRWRFEGWGASFNYPGHTVSNGPHHWRQSGTSTEFSSLMTWVAYEAVHAFMEGCRNNGCSHKTAEMKMVEPLTEGGPTTSGAPPLFSRVW